MPEAPYIVQILRCPRKSILKYSIKDDINLLTQNSSFKAIFSAKTNRHKPIKKTHKSKEKICVALHFFQKQFEHRKAGRKWFNRVLGLCAPNTGAHKLPTLYVGLDLARKPFEQLDQI